MAWLEEADLIVAEVTTPSLGVGYEIAYAEMWRKPVICLYKKDSLKKLSTMIIGANKVSGNIQIFEYEEISELSNILNNYFSKIVARGLK